MHNMSQAKAKVAVKIVSSPGNATLRVVRCATLENNELVLTFIDDTKLRLSDLTFEITKGGLS
jgi:hypothetical protein